MEPPRSSPSSKPRNRTAAATMSQRELLSSIQSGIRESLQHTANVLVTYQTELSHPTGSSSSAVLMGIAYIL